MDLPVKVLDDLGNPVAGATVRLYRRVGQGAVFETAAETDAKGAALFLQPAVGDYLVTASKQGYVGTSTFAVVAEAAVTISDLRLLPVAQLRDFATGTVSTTGGSITTKSQTDIAQSSITVPPNGVAGPADVTIGTLVGQQVPVTQPGLVALSAVTVSVSGQLKDSVTVSLGMPFDVPGGDGLTIPVYGFSESANAWVFLANGTIQNGQIVVDVADLGTISALASFVPRRAEAAPNFTTLSRELGPQDGPVLTFTWTPELSFPEGAAYSDKTKTWIRGVLEQNLGLRFGEPVSVTVTRDPGQAQRLEVVEHVDQYTIDVTIGAAKPARQARLAKVFSFIGLVKTLIHNLTPISHSGGFGGLG